MSHYKKDVICHTTVLGLAVLPVGIQSSLIVKPVAILIEGIPVITLMQTDGIHAQLRKTVQFIRLGDTVVVVVNP